jgi:hypothetical protein
MMLSFPSRLSCLCCYLRAFLTAQFRGSRMATLESTQTAQGDGGRVFGRCGGRFVLRSLARGLKHDLVGKLIWVAGPLL